LFNVGKEMYIAQPGERLGQLIPMQDVMGVRMEQVENKEDLPETARGDKGFGSTGK
jgi:dUTPase